MSRVWRCGTRDFTLDSPLVMGILNATPDSFSDGGRFSTRADAVRAGLSMTREGADIVDVGGESTRPGADAVPVEQELGRVLEVVGELAADVAVSIDTRNAQTARACLDAGAVIVNDISGFRDPAMIDVVASADCGCVIMHMLGEPKTMQRGDPSYADVVVEVGDYLVGRAAALEAAGVDRDRIAIDPGIGFGKTVAHNLEIVRRIGEFGGYGYPVVLGASRKSFLGAVLGATEPTGRVAGSLAVAAYAASMGVDVLRVHDVRETADVLETLRAVDAGSRWERAQVSEDRHTVD